MELVYLWVEEYKNIKEEGFNFSPRFECEFKAEYDGDGKLKDNCELVIKPKEHLENFFGKNINVTAIVGENGSGKSSVLDALRAILIKNETISTYLFIVKNSSGDLIQYCSSDVEVSDVNNKIKNKVKNHNGKILEEYKHIASLFITNEYIEKTFFEKIKYESEQSNTIQTNSEKKNINTKILENAKKYANVQFIKDAKNFFLPTKVRIKIESLKGLKNLKDEEQKKIEELKKEADGLLAESKYEDYLQVIYKIFEIFKNSESYPKSTILKTIDKDYIYGYNEDLREKYSSLLNKLEKKDFGNNIFYEFIVSELDEEKLTFLKSINNIHIFKIELLDANKSFESLSYGERQLLSQLHLILNHFDWKKVNTFDHSTSNNQPEQKDEVYENINIEKYFLFIDEFELGLHPNWQKKTLSYMIDFFKMFDIKIDLFITSHSPFILSDLPKENVIFLENGKQVDPKIETFGANIHTLLSHGFFMKDGLMGEFAKGKINEAIKYLNQKTLTKEQIDYSENIISIVGEPILKRQLQRMLDSKRLTKINDIDKKIKDMEYELSVLKKYQKKATNDELKDKAKRKYSKKKKDDK